MECMDSGWMKRRASRRVPRSLTRSQVFVREHQLCVGQAWFGSHHQLVVYPLFESGHFGELVKEVR